MKNAKIETLKEIEEEIRWMKPHERSDISVIDGTVVGKGDVIKMIESKIKAEEEKPNKIMQLIKSYLG